MTAPPRGGPPRPLFGRAPLPLPTGREATDFDRRARETGIEGAVLMENAGRAAAQLLHHLHPRGPIRVLAGSGKNGGDGIVLARTLHAFGRSVEIGVLGSRPDPEPLLHGHPVPISRLEATDSDGEAVRVDSFLAGASVAVDGLLGTGILGAPREPAAGAIRALGRARERGLPVLALDLPSGVDADSGACPEDVAGADVTVAFGAPKLGTLLHPGRAACGRLVAVEIGFPPWVEGSVSAFLLTPEWASRVAPHRALRTHKKAEGRLLLLGGEPGMTGALLLAARAALRAGAGYLRIAAHPESRDLVHAAVPEAVFVDALDAPARLDALRDSDAVAAGPGLGQGDLVAALEAVLSTRPEDCGLLLDADALRLLGKDTPPFAAPGGGAWKRTLLTPHPGEASALLGVPSEALLEAPLRWAREGAERWRCAFLLKGTPSVVATPDGDALQVSLSGSSEFARAGMGDVLTGVAGALLARGTTGAEAGGLALHWTGRAADHLARGDALLPSDLEHTLPEAIAESGPGETDLPFPFVLLDLPAAH